MGGLAASRLSIHLTKGRWPQAVVCRASAPRLSNSNQTNVPPSLTDGHETFVEASCGSKTPHAVIERLLKCRLVVFFSQPKPYKMAILIFQILLQCGRCKRLFHFMPLP
jgi:hypothetical protein